MSNDDVGSASVLASSTVGGAGAGTSTTAEPVIKYTPSFRFSADETTSEITLAAHSNEDRTLVGGKTAAELADAFATMFSGRDKGQLKHFYFISCEAGMPSRDGGASFAQKFAGEMERKGFSALNIHAAAPPSDQHCVGMRVEVITRGGASGSKPGHVTAFLYKNPYSEKLDDLITKLSERVEFLKIEAARRELSGVEEAELRRKRNDVTSLLRMRNSETDYQKVDIFSGKNYKETMQSDCYTFTARGRKAEVNDIVAFTIMQLEDTKLLLLSSERDGVFADLSRTEWDKFLGYINGDIRNLKALPLARQHIGEVEKVLEGGRNRLQLSTSTYYNTVIKAIKARLRERGAERTAPTTNLNKELPAIALVPTAQASEPGNPGAYRRAVHLTTLGGRPRPAENFDTINKRNELIERLKAYQEQRKQEWSYHFNFLGIMSVVYFVLDALTGSDHFNSKHREVKLSATEELLNSLNTGHSAVLEKQEAAALQEGRLGGIIAEFGGLDEIAKLSPQSWPGARLTRQ